MMIKRIALIDDVHLLTVQYKDIAELIQSENSPVIYWEKTNQYFQMKLGDILDDHTVCLTYSDLLPLGEKLFLHWDEIKIPVYAGAIVRTEWFDKHYTNTNSILGSIYEETATTFTIWAPTATSVKLAMNDNLILMGRGEKGLWHLKIHGDWHGFPYHFIAKIN